MCVYIYICVYIVYVMTYIYIYIYIYDETWVCTNSSLPDSKNSLPDSAAFQTAQQMRRTARHQRR